MRLARRPGMVRRQIDILLLSALSALTAKAAQPSLSVWSCPVRGLCSLKGRHQEEEDGELSSKGAQGQADQSSTEDLCYTIIHHSVPKRRPSGNSAEEFYENVSPRPEKPKKKSEGTETEYSLLRVTYSPKHTPSPDEEYELLMPDTIFSHSLQQPRMRMPSSETQFSHLS
ncbi:Germinal center-associated signaling and motility protein [Galemys pyrenaicus]|uniref:Germinal center-associated signaling and motility protein n=1 Tax=Galemys pyrenaicus TaxID=202257 RepID=A0A8J6DJ18_GALPY|nr:Germinal center-associated signaling and motility protein [Galemys pyrenaicus]